MGHKYSIMRIFTTAFGIIRPLVLGLGIFAATFGVAAAQMDNPRGDGFDPAYNSVNTWQRGWDTGNYDRQHVLLGTVGSFAPYRLTLLNQNGDSATVDLKNGTVIRPRGMTPSTGQRVAVFGYWSNGTFIANRVVLHG